MKGRPWWGPKWVYGRSVLPHCGGGMRSWETNSRMMSWKGHQGQGRAASQAKLPFPRAKWGISVRNGAQMRRKRTRTHVRGCLNKCWRHNANDSSLFVYEVSAWPSQVYLKHLEWYGCPSSDSNTRAYFQSGGLFCPYKPWWPLTGVGCVSLGFWHFLLPSDVSDLSGTVWKAVVLQ